MHETVRDESQEEASVTQPHKLELVGIEKYFSSRRGVVHALQPIDLAVDAAEFLVIVGPSGCGKSTLLMIAAGLEAATRGRVLVDGRPSGPPGPDRCVVFQRFALFPAMTAFENIEFGLRMEGVPRPERRARVGQQLELMRLTEFADAHPHELSGGMQQRVALARSLVLEPDILLMDEPFGALDAQTRTLLQEEVARISQDLKLTVLFVTHSVDEAVYLGNRIIVMTRRPGQIKSTITIPENATWRLASIASAAEHAEFRQVREEVWSLVREEIELGSDDRPRPGED